MLTTIYVDQDWTPRVLDGDTPNDACIEFTGSSGDFDIDITREQLRVLVVAAREWLGERLPEK